MGFALWLANRETFSVQLPSGYGPEFKDQWETWETSPLKMSGVWEISSADMEHLRQAMYKTGVLINVALPDWPDPFWTEDYSTLTDEALDFLEQRASLPWRVPAFFSGMTVERWCGKDSVLP
jgi:hypothetical protein